MPEQEAPQPQAQITPNATPVLEAGMGSAAADTAADREDYNNETANEAKKETVAEKEQKCVKGNYSQWNMNREGKDKIGLERPISCTVQLDPSSLGGGSASGKTHRVDFSGECTAEFSNIVEKTCQTQNLDVEDLNANMGHMMLIESITGNSITGKKVDASAGVGTARFSKDEQIPAIFNSMKSANLIPAGKNFTDLTGKSNDPAQQMQEIKNLMTTHIGNQPGAGNKMDVAQVRFYEDFVDTQIKGFSNDATVNQDEANTEAKDDEQTAGASMLPEAIAAKVSSLFPGLAAAGGATAALTSLFESEPKLGAEIEKIASSNEGDIGELIASKFTEFFPELSADLSNTVDSVKSAGTDMADSVSTGLKEALQAVKDGSTGGNTSPTAKAKPKSQSTTPTQEIGG